MFHGNIQRHVQCKYKLINIFADNRSKKKKLFLYLEDTDTFLH